MADFWTLVSTIDINAIIKDFLIAAAGAIGGAYGAQIIAEKAKSKEELVKEIRNTNASLALTFSICNSLFSLKGQHVQRMRETHAEQRAGFLDHIARRQRGENVPEFRFLADWQALSLPYLPVEILQKQLFEKLSVRGRALNLITSLTQSLGTLQETFEKRNELIRSYQARNLSQQDLPILYFGLPYNGGHVNNEYPSTLDILFSVTNDSIFFSHLLGKDLIKHGRRLVRRFEIKYGKDAPRIDKADFSIAIARGLMPPSDDYRDWLTMFMVKPRPPKSFWVRTRNRWHFWRKRGLA